MKYIIRNVEKNDKDFLLKLRKITMVSYLEKAGIFLSEEEHLDRVNSFLDSSYIIEDIPGESIWLLKYIEDDRTLELVQLQILPEYQGKGMGTEILNDLINKARKWNKRLTLKVLKNNPSKLLYERVWLSIVWEDEIEYHMEI